MSLTYLKQQIEAVREKAESVSNQLARTVKEIQADPKLSDEGKSQEISQWQASSKAQMKDLRAEEDRAIEAAITDRERKLDAKIGTTSSDLIAFRDAQDRAERITDADEAERVLARAFRTDDHSLAHAIFRRALEANWNSVTRAFTQQNPDLSDVASELRTLTSARSNTMERTMVYAVWN